MSHNIPSPEEIRMREIMRRLKNLGYAKETFPCLPSSKSNELLPVSEKKPDERESIKITEGAFPGEFSVMRISG